MSERRIKVMQYHKGNMIEVDLGPALSGMPENLKFTYEHGGCVYQHCYVTTEHSNGAVRGFMYAIVFIVFGFFGFLAACEVLLRYW